MINAHLPIKHMSLHLATFAVLAKENIKSIEIISFAIKQIVSQHN